MARCTGEVVIDLRTALPRLLPKAVAWAEEQQADILTSGFPLTAEQVAIAQGVGVAHPESIRIKLVDAIPLPQDPELAAAALQAGLLGPDMAGLTLFYGIFICHKAYGSRDLIAHECRHVYQHEQCGSIKAFLQEYLVQIVTVAYENAPLEQDARRAAAPIRIKERDRQIEENRPRMEAKRKDWESENARLSRRVLFIALGLAAAAMVVYWYWA